MNLLTPRENEVLAEYLQKRSRKEWKERHIGQEDPYSPQQQKDKSKRTSNEKLVTIKVNNGSANKRSMMATGSQAKLNGAERT